MNRLLFYFIFIISTKSFCQENKIDSLNKRKQDFINQKKVILDSLDFIEMEISAIGSDDDSKFNFTNSIIVLCPRNTKLKKNPEPMSDVIYTLDSHRKVIINDYFNGYFGVCMDSICGYINEVWIPPTDTIIAFKSVMQKANKNRLVIYEEQKRIKQEQINAKILKDTEELHKKNIKKYGSAVYNRLQKGEYWLGITDEMALISMGWPDDINRTVGVWGVHEQWVYSKKKLYLYFENDILTSYQNQY